MSSPGSQTPNLSPSTVVRATRVIVSFVLSILLIGGGVAGFQALLALKEAPQKRVSKETVFSVRVLTTNPNVHAPKVHGFGTVRASRRVAITPEVRGTILNVHPKLRAGGLIEKGETLFEVDSAKYVLKVEAVTAKIELLQANLQRVEQERINAQALVSHAEELYQVAQKDVDRLKTLLKKRVGTMSQLEGTKRIALSQRTNLVNSQGVLALIKPRKMEMSKQLESAKVELKDAKLDVERAKLLCPFRAKIEVSNIEKGNYVQPGQVAVVLVDQSELEILVSLPPEDARHLNPVAVASGSGYEMSGKADENVGEVKVDWTPEGRVRQSWKGLLGRLESVDASNRSFRYVVVVTNPWKKFNPLEEVPLTVGMFCRVSLPGRTVSESVILPRELIEDGRVPIVKDGRLDFAKVEIVRRLDQGVIIKGLPAGTQVVVTKIPYQTRGMALKVVEEKGATQ
ncbi:MAG: hypothetical protein P1V97_14975 [Planctomycetota bacterium]|nr:hypothetical protein [Planctomycetota bacterium]